MMPVLFTIPGLGWEVPGYGLMLMIGFLLSTIWAANRAARSGANPDVVLNSAFIALIGGVVGARIMYVWHYWDQFATGRTGFQLFRALIDVRKGGLEVYGGIITVLLGVLIYLWLGRHSIRWYIDIMAPSAALGMAIGRLGCLLNGCCWGGACDLPWAVTFPFGSGAARHQWIDQQPGAGIPQELLYFSPQGVFSDGGAAYPVSRESLRATEEEVAAAQRTADQAAPRIAELRGQLAQAGAGERTKIAREIQALGAAFAQLGDLRSQMRKYGLSAAELKDLAARHRSLPVHPAQLYSALALGLLALLLSAVYWRRTYDGQVICTLLLIEPPTRWMIEVLRADNPIDTLGTFTISQFLAVCLSIAGLLGLILLRYLPPRSPRAVLWEPPPEQVPKKKSGKGAAASSA